MRPSLIRGAGRAPRTPKVLTDDPHFRPSEWHIALVRDSLIRVLYHAESHRSVQDTLRQKAERLPGKQVSFRKHLKRQYGLQGDDRQANRDRLWNIASAGWEPSLPVHAKRKAKSDYIVELDTAGATEDELNGGLLQAAHIVPQCFGKNLFRRIFGNAYNGDVFWAPGNGLLLPRGIAAAMDDWSISVVPDLPDHDPQPGCVQKWMSSHPAQDFKFRVIDPADENLSRRITLVKGNYRTGRDLHGVRVFFPRPFRPNLNYLYFNHCCAIVKKNRGLFRDPTTDWFVLRFRKAEQERIELEEGAGAVQHRPLTREYDLQAFWRGMLNDLARMEEDPKGTVVDWTMSLRYLEKAEEPLKMAANAEDAAETTAQANLDNMR